MTNLNKIVRRRTLRPFDHHGRRIVAQLEPGDILAMREERCKQWFRISIQTLFVWLVRRDAEERFGAYKKRIGELTKAGASRRSAKTMARRELLK